MQQILLNAIWSQAGFYGLLALSTLLVLIPPIVTFFNDFKKKKNEVPGKDIRLGKEFLLLIVGITGAIIFFYQGTTAHLDSVENETKAIYKDSIYEELLKTNNKETSDLKDSIDILNRNSKYEGSRLRDSLIAAKDQIIKDQFELRKNVLGEGYPILQLVESNRKGEFLAMLSNRGKYPIYDVTINGWDYDSLKNCKYEIRHDSLLLDAACYFGHVKVENVPLIEPNSLKSISYSVLSSAEYKKFEFKISSRNLMIIEQAIFKMTNVSCPMAYRIFLRKGDNFYLVESKSYLPELRINWSKEFFQVNNRIAVQL